MGDREPHREPGQRAAGEGERELAGIRRPESAGRDQRVAGKPEDGGGQPGAVAKAGGAGLIGSARRRTLARYKVMQSPANSGAHQVQGLRQVDCEVNVMMAAATEVLKRLDPVAAAVTSAIVRDGQ